jgi:hypothetical protein
MLINSLRAGILTTFIATGAIGCSAQAPPAVKISRETAQGEAGDAKQPPGPAGKNEPFQRKIIYTARLDVIVSDFDAARQRFEQLYEEAGGYVEKSEFSGNIGARRTGDWTVRVPVEKFHAFVKEVAGLGQPQKHATEARDVSEEYVDTKDLVKNLKEEEETLNRLLKEQAKSMADVVAWKEKVALIRREISRNEVHLQTLGRLSAMSTVHVTLRDEKEYIPKTDPAYGATAGKTLDDSWRALRGFGEGLFIGLVALLPWLPLIVVVGFAMRRGWKRSRLGRSVL